ncbi:MAG: type II toxin-antitoxin system RelE/ParE family toxin [Acidobacteriia bacterium]|nr:type II toxin-antitoxin system RelE/ParE family toxin [Terriglobia bacterium]
MAVVETETFLASAARLGMSGTERTALIIFLAGNPEAGVVVPETGGVRKFRWALPGRGKSGGARPIYYYHNKSMPPYALDIYAKNQKANLSFAEKRAMRKTIAAIKAEHDRRR